jgi:hypothetical protein
MQRQFTIEEFPTLFRPIKPTAKNTHLGYQNVAIEINSKSLWFDRSYLP